MICKISSRNYLGIWRLQSYKYGCIINASELVHIPVSFATLKNAMKSRHWEVQPPKISIKQIHMQQSLSWDIYSQFLSLANSRIDLYAFNNPCSERSTLTLLISVVGGFVILEQIFATSVSKIILSWIIVPLWITHHHKFRQYIEQRDRNSRECSSCQLNG